VEDTLKNIKQNGEIVYAMTNQTNENGEIEELAVTDSSSSNMYSVYAGTVNLIKVAHAKKALKLNFTKGDTAAEDLFIYDIPCKYNTTNSSSSSTVLSSLNLSAFVKMDDTARDNAESGLLSNSTDISVDWEKLQNYKDVATYEEKHIEFHNQVAQALIKCDPFTV